MRAEQCSNMQQGFAGVQHGKSDTTLDAACYAEEAWIKITMGPRNAFKTHRDQPE